MSKQDKAAHPDPEKLGPIESYRYARFEIKGPWKEAEEVIRTDARAACMYAEDILKRRWYEAEEVIRTDIWEATSYAIFVIKGPWPELEEILKTAPPWDAYRYEDGMAELKGVSWKALGRKASDVKADYFEYYSKKREQDAEATQ